MAPESGNDREVGYGKPPKHSRFSSTNQPPNHVKGPKKKLPELDVLLADILGGGPEENEGAMKILRAMHVKAVKGDVKAAELLLNRWLGKPQDHIDHTTKGEKINGVAAVLTREEKLKLVKDRLKNDSPT